MEEFPSGVAWQMMLRCMIRQLITARVEIRRLRGKGGHCSILLDWCWLALRGLLGLLILLLIP